MFEVDVKKTWQRREGEELREDQLGFITWRMLMELLEVNTEEEEELEEEEENDSKEDA